MQEVQPDTKLPKTKVIKLYTALLNCTGTDNPVATILHNTMTGEFLWERVGTGFYVGTLTGAVPLGKSTIMAECSLIARRIVGNVTTNDTVSLQQQTSSNVSQDGLSDVKVEIRAYETI